LYCGNPSIGGFCSCLFSCWNAFSCCWPQIHDVVEGDLVLHLDMPAEDLVNQRRTTQYTN
jgi:hypothetical protein